MRFLIAWVVYIVAFSFPVKADLPVQLRRICKSGTSNFLYFTPSNDTCTSYFQYKVWGRNGPFSPFILIDSITNKSQNQYEHIDANPIGSPTKWSYYIEIIDSCGPDFNTSSTIIDVDETPPNTTFIQYVTVDPITNKVFVAWSPNTSPDFSYYILYKDSSGIYVPVYNGKDTSTLDNNTNSNPALRSITYDISPVDSCGNAKVFGVNPHTTIHLQQNNDTCNNTVRLSWSPYVGWAGISAYYVYKRTESGAYVLIDSVFPPQTTYSDTITLGLNYGYFVVAVQTGNTGITSSSNSVQFTTRFRNEPNSSYLALVSVDKPNDPTILIRIYNPNQESKKWDVFTGPSFNETNSIVGSISNPTLNSGLFGLQIPFIEEQKYYSISSYNSCGTDYPGTNKSRYIKLSITPGDKQNSLSWDPYFTWNSGVNYYRIHRGTSNEFGAVLYTVIDSVGKSDSTYVDSNLPDRIGEKGLCYYIEAIQKIGDINGPPLSSYSTTACATGEPTVYIPNAFRPEGLNSTFRPEGMYIDYDLSRMEIFDRWGGRLIDIQGIRKGWDGKDLNGVYCMQGVYFYKIYIISTNGIEKTFVGFVTLLN